ncbi:MAG: carboxylesterase [Nevskia sp.]|nr:carboxylesterase [Nevskia sp.]
MWAGWCAAVFGAATLALPAVLHADAQQDVAHVDGGTLQGAHEGAIASFKNIPYAAPPLGALRWRAPAAPEAWSGVRDATHYGNDCMQNRMSWDKTASTQPLSEDCLYLNVWAPAPADAGKKLPVLVWLHGGGFVGGSGTAKVTDGSLLAARGAVVVSFNYRLGRFGFFAHPALSAESPDAPVGNYGFMDQIAALQWVKRNVAAFGGDPGNVTIYGESAGGESVNILMLAPQARGLFHKAIVSSGGGRTIWPQLRGDGKTPAPVGTPAPAETVAKAFAVKAGVAGDDLAALRALPAAKVLGSISMLENEKATYSGPMVDGRIVTGDVAGGFAAGKQAKVPYIVGANSNELGFLPSFFLRPMIAEFSPRLAPDLDKIKAAYGTKDAFDTYFANDFIFVEPAHFLAGAADASGAHDHTFLYRFNYVAEGKRKSLKGAPHASDVPYVFGNLAATGEAVSDADRAMAQLVGDYWIAFAATGTPAAAGHAAWPAYSSKTDQLLEFSPEAGSVAATAGDARLAAIAGHFAQAGSGAVAAAPVVQAVNPADAACAALQNFKMDAVHVDSAQSLAPTDTLDLGIKGVPPLPVQAAFCRVQATLAPTPSSQIRIEVWLPPQDQWNGKFIGAGNGGYAGTFTSPYIFMRGAVAKGYAAAGTDGGHSGDGSGNEVGADWALGQPEKLKDYGYRANHLTAETGKALLLSYYGKAQQHSIFEGCSDGGREALMEAYRFPEDYDGIIAGAPANPWTRLMGQFAWNTLANTATPEATLPAAKLSVLQDAVMKKCDALDGVKDGVLEDPRRCKFDPATVQCAAGDREDCLTAAQVQTARKIYQGPKSPRTGKSLGPGFPPGSEAVQWNQWITGPTSEQAFFSTEFFRNMVFEKPDWSLSSLDFDKDLATASARTDSILSAQPDLGPFAKRGGKLIMYHGWGDAAISPLNSIDYYQQVRAKVGGPATDAFMRFYLVPGMSHCLAGPGPNAFDMLGSLTQWIEKKTPPADILATKYANDYAQFLGFPPGDPVRTRPLCPYPKIAHWTGKGSSDQAENFVCRAD